MLEPHVVSDILVLWWMWCEKKGGKWDVLYLLVWWPLVPPLRFAGGGGAAAYPSTMGKGSPSNLEVGGKCRYPHIHSPTGNPSTFWSVTLSYWKREGVGRDMILSWRYCWSHCCMHCVGEAFPTLYHLHQDGVAVKTRCKNVWWHPGSSYWTLSSQPTANWSSPTKLWHPNQISLSWMNPPDLLFHWS